MRAFALLLPAALCTIVASTGHARPDSLCAGRGASQAQVGASDPNEERASWGCIGQPPPEPSAAVKRPAMLMTWVGVTGANPERRTLGYSEAYGIRNGDDDDPEDDLETRR